MTQSKNNIRRYMTEAAPPSNSTNGHLYIAVRIADKWRDTIPTHHQLMELFGMSKATAHRWRGAFKDARGVHR